MTITTRAWSAPKAAKARTAQSRASGRVNVSPPFVYGNFPDQYHPPEYGIDLEEGLSRYRKLVTAYHPCYWSMELLHRCLILVAYTWLGYTVSAFIWKLLRNQLARFYIRSSVPRRQI